MTPISLVTLLFALATIITSSYNLYHFARVWREYRTAPSAFLAAISLMTGILGTFFVLVWFIQLEDGFVSMPIRNTWRTVALGATMATAFLQTGLLLNARKEK
jgi:hypothetical protein